MSRTTTADKWAMTGTEKNIAFDAKGELVAAPVGKKTAPVESSDEPENDVVPEPEATGADTQMAAPRFFRGASSFFPRSGCPNQSPASPPDGRDRRAYGHEKAPAVLMTAGVARVVR
ncbi:hypothetical protein [Bifidobacterium moukalabense]|uniref:Gas vesicle protein n=1 Tax=Bifidobacterium moukalabense DSM 27321 TaxID=1435051 RepID=W4N8G8_9BIFI|nr:gas vesicle protein [Bifidobacterium moukalabense DSM 27321]